MLPARYRTARSRTPAEGRPQGGHRGRSSASASRWGCATACRSSSRPIEDSPASMPASSRAPSWDRGQAGAHAQLDQVIKRCAASGNERPRDGRPRRKGFLRRDARARQIRVSIVKGVGCWTPHRHLRVNQFSGRRRRGGPGAGHADDQRSVGNGSRSRDNPGDLLDRDCVAAPFPCATKTVIVTTQRREGSVPAEDSRRRAEENGSSAVAF